ncbi:aspartyl-phosphate phosphatase Spo0E family protein [Paenibacillus lautus]|uniref:aspartyl-phosphate phosphatase Spo0E family protein n=1 Tax=Paenibacillus lautus TaxID=1401 RepID=UPI001C101774|nr:aspartyl-phosphate phosphatase Spo0E family protein [Paenibacillus lautus]MBU5344684.1 aspartyl-phosphate phosphatase Spo0E family protein [Paenibacillus lautus]
MQQLRFLRFETFVPGTVATVINHLLRRGWVNKVISIESELKQVSKKLELLRKELERMTSSFELVHQDVVAISQSLDKLIVRYMELKNQEEYIKKK